MIIEVIPDINISNSKLSSFLTNIHSYKNLFSRMDFKNKRIASQNQIAYEILFTKENISFYYIIPDELEELAKNELNVCYPKATFKSKNDNYKIEKNNGILNLIREDHMVDIADAIELELEQHSFLSLKVDLRAEYPLSSLLETSKILKGDEKVLIQYVLVPCEPSTSTDFEEAIREFNTDNKVRTKHKLDRERIIKGGLKLAYSCISEVMDLASLFFTNQEYERLNLDELDNNVLFRNGLSQNTKDKSSSLCYDTSVRIATNSKRGELILKLFYRSFNILQGDNKLVTRKIKRHELVGAIKERRSIEKINEDALSTKELAQFMQLPTKTYQEEYNIKNIDTREINIPKELTKGNIKIGEAMHKGSKQLAYWNDNYNILSLPKVIIGPMGAGKTEYIKNFAIEANKKGDSVVIIDYIKNCELANDVNKCIKDAVVINMADLDNTFLLAYNEVEYSNSLNNKIEIASQQANLVEYLIQTLTDDDTDPMSSRMKRYLYAACTITFINENENIKTVFDILTNYQVRNKYINKAIESRLFTKDSIEILDLKALDDLDKKGNAAGNKDTKIEGIIDRLNILLRNIYLRRMLTGSNKVNFVELFDERKTILIKIPEDKFSNKHTKDVIVTFLLTKIWLAELIRGSKYSKPSLVHIITDEIHQLNTASKFLATNIDEVRKFGCDYVFTVHYLKQFKSLLEGIKASGVSYMLLAGTEKENLKEIEAELQPFTMQDGLNLKPFHSLNLINNGNDRVRFITKLPLPVK